VRLELRGRPAEDYRLGLPVGGTWDEVLNTDADAYSGSGVGNLGSVTATDEGWNNQPASATVTLPRWARSASDPPRGCPMDLGPSRAAPCACDGKAEEERRGSAALPDENAASAVQGVAQQAMDPIGHPLGWTG
jgi:hypothetical protein